MKRIRKAEKKEEGRAERDKSQGKTIIS